MKEDSTSWKEIVSPEDIRWLLDEYGCFRDACLKEAWYYSGHYVSDELRMSCGNKTCIRMIFHRQYKGPAVLEMKFSGVTRMNLIPPQDRYICNIFGATLTKDEDLFYWAETEEWNIEDEDNQTTWVAAWKV